MHGNFLVRIKIARHRMSATTSGIWRTEHLRVFDTMCNNHTKEKDSSLC